MMYCPLKTNQYGNSKECLESNCAWWDRSKSCCAVLSIAIKVHFNSLNPLEQVIQDAQIHTTKR